MLFRMYSLIATVVSVVYSALNVCFSAVTENLIKIWILCPVDSGGSNICPGPLMT